MSSKIIENCNETKKFYNFRRLYNKMFVIDFQMEIARVKIIEDENMRLHQTLDKSNHGNI